MNAEAGIFWLVILLIGNAFFVGAEFAIMSARRSQIEPLADAGTRRAKTTLWAMEHVCLMLACAQLGITVCSLLILHVAEPPITELLLVPLEHWASIPHEVSYGISFLVALLLVTFLHVTLGEMVPKNISVSTADKAAPLLAPPLVYVSKGVRPVISVLNWSANHILRLMRIEPKDEVSSTFTLEGVQSIVQEFTRHGLVDDESGLISSSLEFSGQTARSVMVPLEELVTIDVDATPEEFGRLVRRTGFSRFPVSDGTNLTGYLHLKDVMTIPEEAFRRPISVGKVRTLANLGPDDEIEDALAVMQRTGSHLARVSSADGRTMGVLYLEDVVEVLVGEIRDATQVQGERRRGE
ncbi:HlyC/CorC family transporter [Arthrobacter deserti]|uniref:HlyC/CorC family transporter n=1 Tax=Arthrobacter deserti TaxID=1742687 RepID=A0ABX1JT11_9MICC|nr:HlyC/CorC family transporter [Arthrobacter deserti]